MAVGGGFSTEFPIATIKLLAPFPINSTLLVHSNAWLVGRDIEAPTGFMGYNRPKPSEYQCPPTGG
jgi:hypothetical protein